MSEHQARLARDERLARERKEAIALRAEAVGIIAAVVYREAGGVSDAVNVAAMLLDEAKAAAERYVDATSAPRSDE